jgi:MinD superfamily P-loop ATPase
MRQLVILSGKGGTGKTTVTAALAHLASLDARVPSMVLADVDVDAANLGLILDPVQEEVHAFRSGKRAEIDPELCIACGRCAEVCRFDAVVPGQDGDGYAIEGLSCEGCASCYYQCPADAITMVEQHAGNWYLSRTRFGPLYHAHLFAGQENSGKLVTLVKQMARLRASDSGADLLLVDGPPGIGCPVIAAASGADIALIVTEPTVSGAHDMGRILGTVAHFGVPALVVINKSDLSSQRAGEIAAYCAEQGVPVIGRLPYDPAVMDAVVRGEPVTAVAGPVGGALRGVWADVSERLLA